MFINKAISKNREKSSEIWKTVNFVNNTSLHSLHITASDKSALQMETKHVHCLCHSRQIILFRRILSFNFSLMPRKFFHFGDTIFPLQTITK